MDDLRSRTHDLKTWPEFYALLQTGEKAFEVRRNDRRYEVGDTLLLREWSPESGYTGRSLKRRVTCIVYGTPMLGLDPEFVVMGVAALRSTDVPSLDALFHALAEAGVRLEVVR